MEQSTKSLSNATQQEQEPPSLGAEIAIHSSGAHHRKRSRSLSPPQLSRHAKPVKHHNQNKAPIAESCSELSNETTNMDERKIHYELIRERFAGLAKLNQIVAMEKMGYNFVDTGEAECEHKFRIVDRNNRIKQCKHCRCRLPYQDDMQDSDQAVVSIVCTLVPFRDEFVVVFMDDSSQHVTVFTKDLDFDVEEDLMECIEEYVKPIMARFADANEDKEVPFIRMRLHTLFLYKLPLNYDLDIMRRHFNCAEFDFLNIEQTTEPKGVLSVCNKITKAADRMLTKAGLNDSRYTKYAVEYASYCWNRLTEATVGVTPMMQWQDSHDPTPSLSHIRVFGCYLKASNISRIFLGCTAPNMGSYADDSHYYCCCSLPNSKIQSIERTRNMFNERRFICNPSQ